MSASKSRTYVREASVPLARDGTLPTEITPPLIHAVHSYSQRTPRIRILKTFLLYDNLINKKNNELFLIS